MSFALQTISDDEFQAFQHLIYTETGIALNDSKRCLLSSRLAKRLRALPDVPTIREAGYPQVECDAWVGVLAPARTPRDIVTLLHREIVKVVQIPEVQDRLVSLGFEPAETNPQELADLIKSELSRWRNVVRTANIKAN